MQIKVNNKILELPAFFPDATYGVVRCLDSNDLYSTKTKGVVINTYHILKYNLNETIKKIKITKYMNFNNIIISDSGGFQVMSLIKNNKKFGKIDNEKIIFKSENKEFIFTPEICIKLQFELGSDIIMCLDDCTKPEEDLKQSVERTINWAKKCKEEYNRLITENHKPLIFAIVQGGNNKELRKYCAEELIKIGFDGYAFGGWPIENKTLMEEILAYTASLLPNNLPKYAMGIGKPEDILKCIKMGYNLFDCVLPTRDARHKRLYIFNDLNLSNNFYSCIDIGKKQYKGDFSSVSEYCDCYCCKNFTKDYLYNLFKIKETLAYRLATIHNLRFYSILFELIGKTFQRK
ncbi:MAG TPA: tRNA guanosine(34) transglycosylase Tgt [Candidatus Nanoarchaeia archaeon]|nr:tRNA guanosine(34) transglycosylase Tgt [Candidatus Nanoarchaeia archaeon]